MPRNLDSVCLSWKKDQVFCPDQEKSPGNRNFHRDNERNAQRWQWNTNWRHKTMNPDNWKVRCGYPWILINWIYLCSRFSSAVERWLWSLLTRLSKFKNFSTKWQSLWRVDESNRIIILSLLTDLIERSVLSTCEDSRVFCLFICASLPLFHRSTASFGRLSASPDSLHSLTPPHYANRISLRSVQDTTPEGVLS